MCFKEAEDFPHVPLAFLEAGNALKGVPHPFPDAQLHRGPCPVQLPVEALAAVTMEIYTEAPSEATRDALRKLSDWLA